MAFVTVLRCLSGSSVLLLALGCGPSVLVTGDTSDGGSADAGAESSTGQGPRPSTTLPRGTGGTEGTVGTDETGPASESSSDSTDDGTFLIQPDGSGCGAELPPGTVAHCSWRCDLWQQDCPRGDKCVPWNNDGSGVFNATRCAEISAEPAAAGEPCLAEQGPHIGDDNCDIGTVCIDVDPETNEGTCQPLCTGSPGKPLCDPGMHCVQADNGSLPLCLETCNPLLTDCADGDVCVAPTQLPVCVWGVDEPAVYGEACSLVNECAVGLACIAGAAPNCDGDGCCTAWCDLSVAEPNPACASDPTHVCTALHQGDAPPGLDDLGLCAPPKA